MTFVDAVTSSPAAPATQPEAPTSTAVVRGCAAAAAVGAAFADGEPTGTGWWDLVLRVGFAVAFTLAAALTPWLRSAVTAGISAVVAGSGPGLIFGLLGFATGLGRRLYTAQSRELGAVSGALTAQALLRLGSFGFFGLSSILAASIAIPIMIGGYRLAAQTTRYWIRTVALFLLFALSLVLLLAALSVLPVRQNAQAGISAAREGLQAARDGDTQRLTERLEIAQTELNQARDGLQRTSLQPLRLVPVIAQHHRAVTTAAEQGAIVAAQAVAVTRDADVEQLRLRQGQFDLDLLASMAPQLESAAVSLERARTAIEGDRSNWLIPAVDDPLVDLVAEIDDVLPEARVSANAARVMPDMLGTSGEKRYLMLIGSPGESREFGGFVGGYALISVNDGDLGLIEAGSPNDLIERASQASLDDPAGYPDLFLAVDPVSFPQNLTATPNIGVIARAARDIFPNLAGAPLDGVVYADPFAIAAMTEFTGPISVPGVAEPLGPDTVTSFIFDTQYRIFDSREDRFDAIVGLAQATAAAFQSADLPGPERLGNVLGPAARAGRLQIATYDDEQNAFLASVQLQRSFVAPAGVDSFAVVQTNGTASKLDLYLHRTVDYTVAVDNEQNLIARAEIQLRSDVPADAPELAFGQTDGTNNVLLSFYSPHRLVGLRVDGQEHEYSVFEEFGFFRYALFDIPLPQGAEATIEIDLEGQAPSDRYRLAVWSQPLVHRDLVRVTYDGADLDPVSVSQELAENWLFVDNR